MVYWEGDKLLKKLWEACEVCKCKDTSIKDSSETKRVTVKPEFNSLSQYV